MPSLRRLILTIALLCTLTVSMVAASGTTYAQTTSDHTAHTQQSAMHPAKPDMGIKSYWEGTLVTLNPLETRIVAAGSFSVEFILAAIPGASALPAAGMAWYASEAYIHSHCLWIWIDKLQLSKTTFGEYACH